MLNLSNYLYALLSVITLLLIHIPIESIGQKIQFQIVNKDNTGIEYVNIYTPKVSFGTVSDLDGNFELNLDLFNKRDTLIFSCIGYEEKLIPIQALTKLDNHKIILSEVNFQIEEISITAQRQKIKNRKAGVRTWLDLCQNGFYVRKDRNGEEKAILISNKNKCFIESVNFNLEDVSHNDMVYEINIYSYTTKVNAVLNKERIFISFDKDTSEKSFEINVRDQNIKVEGDFVVSFEAVNVRDNNWGINFKSPCRKKGIVLTKDSSGNWIQKKDNLLSIWCKMECIK